MTRTNWLRIEVSFNFLTTGILALVYGFLIWVLPLSVSAAVILFDTPPRQNHMPWAPFGWFHSGWAVATVYGSAFFFGSIFAARSKWSQHPALAAFSSYAIFILLYLPNWQVADSKAWCVYAPLITAPLGGWVGTRFLRPSPR
jgi:hypothetical protein